MSRRQVIDCDGCAAQAVPDPVCFAVVIGTSRCPACAAKHLREALTKLGPEEALAWAMEVKLAGEAAQRGKQQ